MENIGLVTFSTSIGNYGQVLQAYAIQEYLKKRGHNVLLLRQKEGNIKRIFNILILYIKRLLCILTTSSKIRKSYESQYKYIRNKQKAAEEEKKHPRKFEDFRKNHFTIIDNSKASLRNNQITALCAGSDQIWAGHNPFHFLDFGGNNLKRFSLASSTGNRKISVKSKIKIKKWLSRFEFISVREDSGLRLCQELGYNNTVKILDPTFLLQAEDYDKITYKQNNKENYIFVYLLNSDIPIQYSKILNFAKQNDMSVKYVAGQGRIDNENKIYATVPEWLTLLRNSKYVITNSFHGMVFSIIYQKPFLVLPRIGDTGYMNERIVDITKKMGLEERIFNEDIDVIKDKMSFSKAHDEIIDNKQRLNEILINIGL